MVPLFDGPFEHHSPDVPEKDREHAVTHAVTIVTICVNTSDILIRTAARRDPGGFYFG